MRKFKSKKLLMLLPIIILISILMLIIHLYFNNNSLNYNSKNNENNNTTNSTSYYSSLYGTWTVKKHIPSNIKTSLSDSIISLCIGQKFTIEKDEITSFFATISNPVINEGIITASDFSKKYNDNFNNLGIPGDELKYVKITEPNKSNHTVTIFIATDGNVYALLSGALFELEK
ncbi:hypothetical protein [Clostridium sp.]|uniref:hypothetical protein n=1 Tax=Clostridium sp. TaxID=1506 RepID=UPI0026219F13|nr:hypothetical protein [Clostridium sp.]